MTEPELRAYGTWPSPIAGARLVEQSLRLGQLQMEGGALYWTEGRPAEQGRTALMQWRPGGSITEIGPGDMDIRTRVHEYGGAAFKIWQHRIFVINNQDQQIYEIRDGKALQLTREPTLRFADMEIDAHRMQMVMIVEDHSRQGEVHNYIASMPLSGKGPISKLAEGHDFYSNPRISPDGQQLAYLCWDHPNMPWDGTQLHLADIVTERSISNDRLVAGGEEESVFQPEWNLEGSLFFVSDRSGWWNLYRYQDRHAHCLLEMEAEFGLPQWVFGMRTYTFLDGDSIMASLHQQGRSQLVHIALKKGTVTHLEDFGTDVDQLVGAGHWVAFIRSQVHQPDEILAHDLASGEQFVIQKAARADLDQEFTSVPEPLEFESPAGETCHAWFYPPGNPDYTAPPNERPPLIVLSHGGPTAFSAAKFNLAIQYWTTRGFAVADVNYGGSTGYGRAYRKRLNGQWGIRDVEDCTQAALALVERGLVDSNRLIIKGGSAGGYTTLSALTFGDVFCAGASYYGVGDLELLAKDTHKFESRYMDRLIGPYPAQQEIYFQRSPLNFTHRLNCPIIFFQGMDDPVVPPEQAETMVEAMKQKGIPVAYLKFEGESHGFRRAQTIIEAIESEYAFYARIFNLTVDEPLRDLDIYNV